MQSGDCSYLPPMRNEFELSLLWVFVRASKVSIGSPVSLPLEKNQLELKQKMA